MTASKTIKGETIEKAMFWANQGMYLQLVREPESVRRNYPAESTIHNSIKLTDPSGDLETQYLTFKQTAANEFTLYKK